MKIRPVAHNDVEHPRHYTDGGIEMIDFLQAKLSPEEFSGLCKGSAIQYITRSRLKGNESQDIDKARWYLDRWLRVFSSNSPPSQ